MQFKKIRQIMGETIPGDYYGYDTNILADALKSVSPDIQLLDTDDSTQYSFSIICDAEYEDKVREAVKEHGSEEAVKARQEKKDKDEYNAPINAKLAEIDAKTIRALRDNELDWIKKYKEEADIERAKLKK